MKKGLSFILVILMVSSTTVGLAGELTAMTEADGVQNASSDSFILSQNGVSYDMSFMTQDDIDYLKSTIGTRDPNTNYNIMFGDKGTGLAPPTEEGWKRMMDKPMVTGINTPNGALAPSVDFSTDPCFPVVGDQGNQGSCTAWAITYYTYGYLEAKDNNWTDASLGNPEHLMSPGWTYNMVNEGVDWGSWEYDNVDVLKDWGVPNMAVRPYNDADHTSWGDENAYRDAPLHRVKQEYYIPYSGDPTVETVKSIVSGSVPVTFCIDANEYYWGDGNFIISALEYNSNIVNHVQTIVGYNDSITDDGDIGAFRVVNSWGEGHMDGGYYWLTYEAFKEIGDVGELYLTCLEDEPDYVPTMLATWEFSQSPSIDGNTILGIMDGASVIQLKDPFYNNNYFQGSRNFPEFMCLDITEFEDQYNTGIDKFYLYIGVTYTQGIISSFKLERYDDGYEPHLPDYRSPGSTDVPQNNPGNVYLNAPRVQNIDKGTYHFTIQRGIDNANPGDHIMAPSGTYFEHLVDDKGVNITGAGMDMASIDGRSEGTVALLSANGSKINGFKIANSGPDIEDAGIKLSNVQNCIVSDNTLTQNNIGVYVESGENNIIYHNNFIDNFDNALDDLNNSWDNGYPSGGNYWDDHMGVDMFSGPSQTEPGPDCISDNPYVGLICNKFFIQVINETVLNTTGEVWNFNLGYTNFINCTLWLDEYIGDWCCLDPYCSVDYVTGEVTMTDDWPLEDSYVQAWLNYTSTSLSTTEDRYPLMIPWDLTAPSIFEVSLSSGWSFVSLPLIQYNTSIQTVLSSIDGDWDYVQYYDAADASDHWKSYDIYKPASLNDLWNIDHTMGFWLHMTNNSTLAVYGQLPVNNSIQLITGWNLVGYPVQDDSNYTVADLKTDTGADVVEGFNSSAEYQISLLPDSYVLKKGEGYWVHVASDIMWTP